MPKRTRRKKWVLWLLNKTSTKDNDWVVVWAHDRPEARRLIKNGQLVDTARFFPGSLMSAEQFREKYGLSPGGAARC